MNLDLYRKSCLLYKAQLWDEIHLTKVHKNHHKRKEHIYKIYDEEKLKCRCLLFPVHNAIRFRSDVKRNVTKHAKNVAL